MNRQELAAQIRLALASHGMWKFHLQQAATLGQSARSVEEATRDDACSLGRWLSTVDRVAWSPHHELVTALHVQFHEEAGHILGLALDGERAAASRALAPGGSYDRISNELQEALKTWAAAL